VFLGKLTPKWWKAVLNLTVLVIFKLTFMNQITEAILQVM